MVPLFERCVACEFYGIFLQWRFLAKSKSFRANRKPKSFISFCTSLFQSSIPLKSSLSNSFSNGYLVNCVLVHASYLGILFFYPHSPLIFKDSWVLT